MTSSVGHSKRLFRIGKYVDFWKAQIERRKRQKLGKEDNEEKPEDETEDQSDPMD